MALHSCGDERGSKTPQTKFKLFHAGVPGIFDSDGKETAKETKKSCVDSRHAVKFTPSG